MAGRLRRRGRGGHLDPVDPELPIWLQSQVDGVDGRLAPLGWHSLTPASDVPLFDRLAGPAFMRSGEMPERTQVYQDSGPMRIGCRRAPGVSCGLFLVVGSDSVGWFTGDRLGDDAFLQPGEPMQLVPGSTLENGRLQPTVIGGMHGTATARVVITLEDGSEREATVDRGRIARGATVFWGLFEDQPVRATAYDAAGEVVEDHPLTSCDDPIDCQTR